MHVVHVLGGAVSKDLTSCMRQHYCWGTFKYVVHVLKGAM